MGRPPIFLFLFLQFLLPWTGTCQEYQMVPLEPPSTKVKLCTPYIEQCEKILHLTDVGLECVHGNGKIGCLDLIAKKLADFMPLHAEELYVASQFGESPFRIVGEIRDRELAEGTAKYSPVAVVRNSANIRKFSDLRGKKSCHTGFGRNAGYRVPFALLKPDLNCPAEGPVYEKDIAAVSSFFKEACLGGNWVPEQGIDAELKRKYSNLCSLCEGDCSPTSAYFGYEGALKCLEKGADVAWTKLEAVVEHFKLNSSNPLSSISKYSFLCLNGSTVPLTSPNACSTSSRPWAIILTHNSANISHVQSTFDLYSSINDVVDVTLALEINTTSQIYYKYDKPRKIKKYLGNFAESFDKASCEENTVKFCVDNELELMKCNELRLAMAGQRIKPAIKCVVAADCLKAVEEGTLDVVAGVKYLQAMERGGLTPLLSELRPTISPNTRPTPFSYSLALTKNPSILNISHLSGMKSCHGSVNNMAGFRLPINYLRKAGLLKGGCRGFFNQSCVPGAQDPDMCALCIGDNKDPEARTNGTKCSNDESETYRGDEGAIQCLLDGAGDVAFVNHVTVLKLMHDPTQNESIADLKLICPHGGQMKLGDYASCNWGRAPSRLIMSKGVDMSTRFALLKASGSFGGRQRPVMDLFGPWYGNDGLIFQEHTVGLTDYDESQIDGNVNLDPCRSGANILGNSALLIVFSFLKLVLAQ